MYSDEFGYLVDEYDEYEEELSFLLDVLNTTANDAPLSLEFLRGRSDEPLANLQRAINILESHDVLRIQETRICPRCGTHVTLAAEECTRCTNRVDANWIPGTIYRKCVPRRRNALNRQKRRGAKPQLDVFCIHAPADRGYREAFEGHLSALRKAEGLSISHVDSILPGEDRIDAMARHIDQADVIVLLLSYAFFSSDEFTAAMQRALDRKDRGEALVVPIRVRAFDYESTPISTLTSLPRNGIPIASRADSDEAWEQVAREFRELVLPTQSKTRR